MRILFPFVALLCASPAMAGLIFQDGDTITGATWNASAGEYKLAAECFIDLEEKISRRDNVITLTYQTIRGSEWLTVARNFILTDQDARSGMDWPDVLPSGDRRLLFPAQDHTIRNVEVWTTQRDPGVPVAPSTFSRFKARN